MQIILMRHGQPSIDLETFKKKKMSPKSLGKIVDDYETVDLNSTEKPKSESIEIAQNCEIILSSDLPRAIGSCQKLGVEKTAIIDAVYRESRPPFLNWERPHLSFFTWCIIFRILWLFGFSKNGESIKKAKQRAKICTDKLESYAHSHKSVLLIGHGIMNRLITKELKAKGWAIAESTGERYWSYSVFEPR